MPTLQIGANAPVQLSTEATQSFLLVNTGPNTIYLGDQSLTVNGGYDLTLGSGASLNWSGGRVLFAICANGQTANVQIQFGANTALAPSPPVSINNGNTISILPNLAFKVILPSQNVAPPPGPNQYHSPVIDCSSLSYLIINWNSNASEGGPNVPAGTQNMFMTITDADSNNWWSQAATMHYYFSSGQWVVSPPARNCQLNISFPATVGPTDFTLGVIGTDKEIGNSFFSYGPVQGGYSLYGLQTNLSGFITEGAWHWDIGFGVPGPVPAGDLIRLAMPTSAGQININETIVQNGAGSIERRFVTKGSAFGGSSPAQWNLRDDSWNAAGTYINQGLGFKTGNHPLYLELLGTGTTFTYSMDVMMTPTQM